jgi:hypothetical protein
VRRIVIHMRSRTAGGAIFSGLSLLLMTAMLALAPAGLHAEQEEDEPAAPGIGAFGPGYDTTKPAPTEPVTGGPGIASAKLIFSGAADVQEFHPPDPRASTSYTVVVLDVHIPAASTTPVLGTTSVFVKAEDGAQTPVYAMCLPTGETPLTVYHGASGRLARWHVTAGGKLYDCGGRNARLAYQVGEGGMRVITESAWDGPMLFFFKTPASPIRHIVVAGLDVEVVQPPAGGDSAH